MPQLAEGSNCFLQFLKKIFDERNGDKNDLVKDAELDEEENLLTNKVYLRQKDNLLLSYSPNVHKQCVLSMFIVSSYLLPQSLFTFSILYSHLFRISAWFGGFLSLFLI